jgi:hypothetical protein
MSDRHATHTPMPLLGSRRNQKTFSGFLEDVPVEELNKSFYNSWALDPGRDTVEVGTDFSANGLNWGTGSEATNEPVSPALTTTGAVNFQPNSNDNDEGLYVGPQVFKPASGCPITYLFEGQVTDVSATHLFVGLAAVTNVDAAGPLVADSGVPGTVDMVGFYFISGTAPSLIARDGAGTLDTVSLTGHTAVDAEAFRFAMEVHSGHIRYYLAAEGSTTVVSGQTTPTNTTLTSLANMGPCLVIQNNGGAQQTATAFRWFVGQKNRQTRDFLNWR